MDERQINNQNPVIFSDERLIGGIFFLAWFVWAGRLCFLGYGEDTDAWLMAQTAQKLSLGLGYDPARSFGNPLYEILLSFFQPNQNWIYTNAFNLSLAVFFLYRLPLAIPFLSGTSLLTLRLSLMAMPLFTEAATSGMEYMLAWVLFLETLIASQKKALGLGLMLLLCLGFVRMELYFFYLFVSQWMEKDKNWIRWFPLAPLTIYLFWAWGKNPSPFSDIEGWFHFSMGRVLFLIRQAGLLTIAFLGFITGLFLIRKTNRFMFLLGLSNLTFFLLFPFEWAYLFPGILFGLMGVVIWLPGRWAFILPSALFLGSFAFISDEGSFKINYPGFFTKRKQMVEIYQMVQSALPKKPLLLLSGATFLPTNTLAWTKSQDNRLFNKTGSRFYVGEKFTASELDSFQTNGFEIIGVKTERGNLSNHPAVTWVTHEELRKKLILKED